MEDSIPPVTVDMTYEELRDYVEEDEEY